MKSNFRFSGISTAFCIVLFFINPHISAGQDASDTASVENVDVPESIDPLLIKLSVNEVRLDVVVVDNRGRPVTDLKAADFEVFQNGARQNVVSSVYIENQSDSAVQPSSPQKDARNLPPLPTAELKREDARRTIIFVVDDISMSFENGYHAKMALSNFVEKQMQTGDMAAVLRTGYGSSARQMFFSDKRVLLAQIDAMRMEVALEPNHDDSDLFRIYNNQLSTLSYSIRALKDMPGRKILIMITTLPTLVIRNNDFGNSEIDFHALYNEPFNRLAEDALRAGVVVNYLNIGGLNRKLAKDGNREIVLLGADASMSNYIYIGGVAIYVPPLRALQEARKASPQNAFNPLPAKTGGIIIENSNFFLEGVGKDVDNLMKGYYLISYEPPANTFSSGDKEIYNRIKVNVKRRNVTVHTRDGFYNRQESEADAAAQSTHPLQNAIFSPFLHTDLSVNMAAGYIRDAKAGYLIRSWVHLDPKDIKIAETEDGGARIDLETVCLTSDINGVIHDLVEAAYSFNIDPENKSENIAWIQKHGIRFAMMLPVKKPGSYYVRTAVQDVESEKVGSAYQFVEIPDLGKKGIALSNIFMITSDEDLQWMLSNAAKGINEGLFFPVFRAEEVRSPALRTYAFGDRLQTLAMIYNVDEKSAAGSEIEMYSILYKDGKEHMRSNPRPVIPGSAGTLEGIPVSQTLTMGSDLLPGDYVIQLVVTDKKNSNKPEGNASQTLTFTVEK